MLNSFFVAEWLIKLTGEDLEQYPGEYSSRRQGNLNATANNQLEK